ncbi:MAG: DUF2029 domain-containing protein [Flavobacteriales bacterium]|nr:DUF2029 domain-containing protein [Flavobacteriales bacterium]MBP7156630.1 DUF2029 domain-containing protein [Flavobacteriales bacterium]HQV75873.1 glycosyltransferase family 87 protein [Flavobacteriales bacterium]HQW41637.1 glycosyltransferase family 87 protein [Flavobacteriales bacterium]
MKDRLKSAVSKKATLLILYVVFALAASIQALLTGPKKYVEEGEHYKVYNNYVIFKQSFHHLKDQQDLYAAYPQEQWDLYKYTPTFSAFFGLFAVLPDWLGLSAWNLLNALVLLFAVYALPRLDPLEKGLVLLIVLIELMTSMQNDQSNGLIAGLLVFAFALLEEKHWALAAFCIVFSAYIKLFGVVGFALFLFYPQKLKLAIYTVLWTVLLFFIPLLFVDLGHYLELFRSYGDLLANDHSTSYGYSVMGWLQTWFGLELSKNIIVGLGAVIFLLPILWSKLATNFQFRLLTLVSVVLWIVIFNHKAESPTFVIAMTGVALWFVRSVKNGVNIGLFVFAILFTTLSPTDIFPRPLREGLVVPFVLKGVPCILIWAKVIVDMLRIAHVPEAGPNSNTA